MGEAAAKALPEPERLEALMRQAIDVTRETGKAVRADIRARGDLAELVVLGLRLAALEAAIERASMFPALAEQVEAARGPARRHRGPARGGDVPLMRVVPATT